MKTITIRDLHLETGRWVRYAVAMKFVYEGRGEHTFQAGDCVLQPAGIVHNELDCSDDVEILEIYSPAVHRTVVVDTPIAAAAAR